MLLTHILKKMIEKTLVLIKPEGIQRSLIGEIIKIYEQKGLSISNIKMLKPSRELMEKHYANISTKPFFEKVIEYTTSNFLIAIIVSGKDAVNVVRRINGETDPKKAELGSIRSLFGMDLGRNLVHGSEDNESAIREIKIWFGEDEGMVKECEWVYE